MKRNSHPVKVVEVKDYEGLYANSHPYKVKIEGGGGGEYSDFTGATEISAGEHGLVPAPKAGEQDKYLKGDGTWASIVIPQSGIPTDATFWGASYDATNNKVDGNIILGSNRIYKTASGGVNRPSFYFDNGDRPWMRNNLSIFGFNSSNQLETNIPLNMGSNRIVSLADPTAAQDAATKNYVDTAVASASAATYTPSEFNNLWENA